MIPQLQAQTGRVALDTRYDPVVISTWEGSASVDLVDRYYGWSDETSAAAMAQEQQLIFITDLTQAQLPDAAVRKRVIEHSNASPAAEIALAHILVVPELGLRTLVRSIARFVSPMAGRPELVFAASIEGAIEISIQLLWKARIPPPAGLRPEGYVAPRRPGR